MEHRLDGAKWRDGRAWDLVAFLGAHLMNAFGAKFSDGPVNIRKLIGRDILRIDDRWSIRADDADGPTAAEMRAFDEAGIPGGMLSDEELARAYAELGTYPEGVTRT